MNITFVSNSFGYGAAKMLLFTARGLQNFGHNVTIIVIGKRGDFDYLAEGLHLIYKERLYENAYIALLNDVYYVYEKAKLLKTDILISFLDKPNFITTIVGKLLNIPSVISERVDPFVDYKEMTFYNKILKKTTNLAKGAVFQTEGASKFYSKKLQKRSVIIPNAIIVSRDIQPIDYKNLPKEILTLGRLNNKQKRLDITLEAFAKFHILHPEYILRIYGRGKDEQYVKDYIKKLGIEDFVFLMGVSNNSTKDLSKGGIFLITSDYEGISNSLLEAMAVGLPVVSTDHSPGGARLLIEDHNNGLLVPIGNSSAITKALCEYAEDFSLMERCGKNASNVKQRFNPNFILDSWNQYIIKISNL